MRLHGKGIGVYIFFMMIWKSASGPLMVSCGTSMGIGHTHTLGIHGHHASWLTCIGNGLWQRLGGSKSG